MRTIICGNGEVGTSLYNVLRPYHDVYIRDLESQMGDIPTNEIDILNICYPCKNQEEFVKTVREYTEKYKPQITIIHSTVPVGTTRLCGEMVVHSPIHGKHPNLEEGIKTFVKYVGAQSGGASLLASRFLEEAGIRTDLVSSPEASELSKLLCTTYYGWNLVFMKEVERLCKELNVPFHEVYTRWNHFYNDGYSKLNMPNFVRPVLDPISGAIGGHCVIPNCSLLDTFVTRTIKERNETYKDKPKKK